MPVAGAHNQRAVASPMQLPITVRRSSAAARDRASVAVGTPASPRETARSAPRCRVPSLSKAPAATAALAWQVRPASVVAARKAWRTGAMTSVAASAATTDPAASSPRSFGVRASRPGGRRKNAPSTTSSAIPAAAPSQSHCPWPLKLSATTAARAVPRSAARSTSRLPGGTSAPPTVPGGFLRALTERPREVLRREGARTEHHRADDSPSVLRSTGRRPWPYLRPVAATAPASGCSARIAANPPTGTSQRSGAWTGSRYAIVRAAESGER